MKYVVVLVCIVSIGLVGCTISRETMRGSIVAIIDGETQVCLGVEDGLRLGDTLTVFRTRQVGVSRLPNRPFLSSAEIARSYQYEKVKVGTVKVTRLFDTHYATVEVIGGEAEYLDVIELKRVP